MNVLYNTLLWETFNYLHPLTLQTCKLVCRQWYRTVNDPRMAEWFFVQRYKRPAPRRVTYNEKYCCSDPQSRDEWESFYAHDREGITYWNQYYPLPGAEKYREPLECYYDALKSKNKEAVEYFSQFGKTNPCYEYVFLDISRRLTPEELEFVKDHVEYVPKFRSTTEYGRLLGRSGDIALIKEELTKISSRYFSIGILQGMCLEGHPQFKEVLELITSHDIILKNNPFNIIKIYRPYPELNLIRSYLKIEFDVTETLHITSNWEVVSHLREIIPKKTNDFEIRHLFRRMFNAQKPGLSQLLLKEFPEMNYIYNEARSILAYYKINNKISIDRLYVGYQSIIIMGDWDILDEFVSTFQGYSQVIDSRQTYRFVFRQRYIYCAINRLIMYNSQKLLCEVLARLDKLFVTNKRVFYRHCLQSAAFYGKKDLVEYFFPYIKPPVRLHVPKKDAEKYISAQKFNRRLFL